MVGFTDDQFYKDIANAIRKKTGSNEALRPDQMAPAIQDMKAIGKQYYIFRGANDESPITPMSGYYTSTAYRAWYWRFNSDYIYNDMNSDWSVMSYIAKINKNSGYTKLYVDIEGDGSQWKGATQEAWIALHVALTTQTGASYNTPLDYSVVLKTLPKSETDPCIINRQIICLDFSAHTNKDLYVNLTASYCVGKIYAIWLEE